MTNPPQPLTPYFIAYLTSASYINVRYSLPRDYLTFLFSFIVFCWNRSEIVFVINYVSKSLFLTDTLQQSEAASRIITGPDILHLFLIYIPQCFRSGVFPLSSTLCYRVSLWCGLNYDNSTILWDQTVVLLLLLCFHSGYELFQLMAKYCVSISTRVLSSHVYSPV